MYLIQRIQEIPFTRHWLTMQVQVLLSRVGHMYMQSQTVQDLQLSRLNQAAPVIQQHLHLVPLELQQLMWQQVCSPIPKVTVILRPLSLTGHRNPAEADTSLAQAGTNQQAVDRSREVAGINLAVLGISLVAADRNLAEADIS